MNPKKPQMQKHHIMNVLETLGYSFTTEKVILNRFGEIIGRQSEWQKLAKKMTQYSDFNRLIASVCLSHDLQRPEFLKPGR